MSSDDTLLVYILAASHSGSTLLAMLLNSHQQVTTAGELKAVNLGNPNEYRCSCRSVITECRYWQSINYEMARRGYDFQIWKACTHFSDIESVYVKNLLKPLHRGILLERARDFALALSPRWRRQMPAMLERNEELIASIVEVSGNRIIVESSKIALRLKYLREMKRTRIRVIRLIRDGRGVALSYLDPDSFADAKDAKDRRGGFGANAGNPVSTMAQAAHEWRRSNEEAEQVLRGIDLRDHIEVHYEDLCNEPLQVIRDLLKFVGVETDSLEPDFRAIEHHIIGNGMRLDSESTIRLDDRWCDVLSQNELDSFDRVAGAMNRGYGYQ